MRGEKRGVPRSLDRRSQRHPQQNHCNNSPFHEALNSPDRPSFRRLERDSIFNERGKSDYTEKKHLF